MKKRIMGCIVVLVLCIMCCVLCSKEQGNHEGDTQHIEIESENLTEYEDTQVDEVQSSEIENSEIENSEIESSEISNSETEFVTEIVEESVSEENEVPPQEEETEQIVNTETEIETKNEIETEVETEVETEESMTSSWVSELEQAQSTSQMIIVACEGSYATVSMHTKNEQGIWVEEFSVKGRIGKNGAGKQKEGDGKTPTGVYRFNMAFGILENPGITVMPYLRLDESHHWVDDSNSQYYNQFVSTRDVEIDWNSSEHLYKIAPSYNYVLSTTYNEECIPNKGSAIFLHCTSRSFGPTAGCIAIPEEYMIEVMKKLQADCLIIIGE